jgi:hypothetical protein
VLPGGFVGGFRELANQLLEHQAHLDVGDGVWVQVDLGELLGHQVQQFVLVELVDLEEEAEPFEDVADVG